MNKNLFISMAAIALMTSCSSTQKMASVADLSGEWTIERINGSAIDKKAGIDDKNKSRRKNNDV